MTIKYPAGDVEQGFLLSRDERSMRVALEGGHDVAEFVEVNGNWMSENLEPVEILFEWQRKKQTTPSLNEEDFICSRDLAARLMHLLATDSSEEESRPKYMVAGREVI